MDLQLTDKVVVITGASSGIGLAATRLFLEQGAKVIGASRSIDTLQRMQNDKLVAVSADISNREGAESVVQRAMEAFGRIDILINNAGIAPIRNGFLSIEDEEWEHVLSTNFMSMVRVTRAALPYMIQQQKGSIVSISSEVGQLPDAMLPDYSTSKAAMLSLSKSIAQEFGPKGIRSNIVSPGPTRTPLWDRPGGFADGLATTFGLEKETAIQHFARNVRSLPLGRLGTSEEAAAIIAFVASDQASFVTGSEYMVNGGSLKQI